MTGFDFFALLESNILLYLTSLFIAFICFYRVMNNVATSWFNPLKFNILTAGVGFSVVVFLFFTNAITTSLFVYIIICFFLFWTLFELLYKNKARLIKVSFSMERYYANRLFYVFYILNVLLTLFSYKMLGVPIFNDDSRLATYANSGGLGIIARLSSIMNIYVYMYIIHGMLEAKSRSGIVFNVLLLLPMILFGVLSGSRSSFMIVIFSFWGYKTFYDGNEPNLKKYKKILIPFLVVSIFTFMVQSAGNLQIALISFGERVVACGDLYWEALPLDSWKQVEVRDPLRYIFMGLLGPLRVWDASLAEVPIGYQLTAITYPQLAGASTGPVALFSVSSLIFYGYYGGLIFTCFQAILTALLFRLVYIKSNSFIICAIAFYIFNELIPFLGDISAAMGSVFNILLNICFVFVVLLIIALWKHITSLGNVDKV